MLVDIILLCKNSWISYRVLRHNASTTCFVCSGGAMTSLESLSGSEFSFSDIDDVDADSPSKKKKAGIWVGDGQGLCL